MWWCLHINADNWRTYVVWIAEIQNLKMFRKFKFGGELACVPKSNQQTLGQSQLEQKCASWNSLRGTQGPQFIDSDPVGAVVSKISGAARIDLATKSIAWNQAPDVFTKKCYTWFEFFGETSGGRGQEFWPTGLLWNRSATARRKLSSSESFPRCHQHVCGVLPGRKCDATGVDMLTCSLDALLILNGPNGW